MGNFAGFLLSADIFFLKINFVKPSFIMSKNRVSNSLDIDQPCHFFGPDLGPSSRKQKSSLAGKDLNSKFAETFVIYKENITKANQLMTFFEQI